MRRSRILAIGVVAVMSAIVTSPALAAGPEDRPDTVIIDGRTFGPDEGVEVVTGTEKLKRGSGQVAVIFDSESKGGITPLKTWGASYAISEETLQIRYDGRAKAAGNLWGSPSKRIIKVCIWYERPAGVQQGDRVCSTAHSDGARWIAGAEATTWCWDDLNPFAPVTQFKWALTLIAPNVY